MVNGRGWIWSQTVGHHKHTLNQHITLLLWHQPCDPVENDNDYKTCLAYFLLFIPLVTGLHSQTNYIWIFELIFNHFFNWVAFSFFGTLSYLLSVQGWSKMSPLSLQILNLSSNWNFMLCNWNEWNQLKQMWIARL